MAWGEGFGETGPGLGCEGLSAAAGEVCGAAVGGAKNPFMYIFVYYMHIR